MADAYVTFNEFCDLCEKIQKQTKFGEKEKLLSSFINKYKNLENELIQNGTVKESSFYPVLRMLVPQYERERSPYGLKENSFSKLYVRTLCLQGSDKEHLLNYNKMSSGRSVNDFADVAYWILRKWCPKKSTLKISEINQHLDLMASKHEEHLPREVEKELSKMIKTSTAIEQKWIIRIILKDMRLGLGNDRILKVFHQDAADLYDVSNSLSKICSVLRDSKSRINELELEIFLPFRPMLCLQCNSTVLNKTIKGEKIFYVENKYDGERFQLHMMDGVFKYFSKNGYEYSNIYGETYDSQGIITPYLAESFSHIRSIILDGEMMGWNKKTKNFGSKGMNFDVKTLTSNSVHRPCFCVFDILLYNNKILTNKPLSERLQALDELIKPIEGVMLKSPRFEVKTKKEILDELNSSMDRHEEGICFKDPDSVYKFNNRKNGWYKMKAEYFDGLLTEMDVLIIGVYYGEGRRQGLIGSFLLGVAATPDNPGDSPSEFHSFAKVASGFTIEELDKLLNNIKPHLKPVEKDGTCPEGILWKKEKPDLWIEPRKSCILQVKASELIRSTGFYTDYTLRFPRVQKVRDDKPWYNCLTVDELKELTKNSKAVEKLSNRHITENDLDVSPSKRPRKQDVQIEPLFHLNNIKQQSNLFVNKEICVLTGNEEYSKGDIEVKIKENGGKVVQHEGPNTFCYLAGDITQRVKNLMLNSSRDIVKLDWLLRSLNNSKLLEWIPEDMIRISFKTEITFSNRFDKYGDSYTNLVTKDSLENILNNVKIKDDYLNLMPSELVEFDNMLSFKNPLGLFRGFFAYFDKYAVVNDSTSNIIYKLQSIETDFRFFGGTVCKNIEDYTTHIVIHSSDMSRVANIKQQIQENENVLPKIVNEKWIKKCVVFKEIISEDMFSEI